MAKITINRSSSSGAGKVTTPRLFTQGLNVRGIEKGIKSLGNEIQRIKDEAKAKKKKAEDTSYVTDSLVKSSEEINRFRSDYQKSQGSNGYADGFIQEADKIYDSYIQNAPSPEAKQTLQRSFASARVASFNDALSTENKKFVQELQLKTEENLNLISNRVFDQPYSIESSLQELNMVVDSTQDVLSPEKTEQFRKDATKKVFSSYALGLTNKGQIEDAKKVLDTKEFNTAFSRKEKDSLRLAMDAKTKEIERNALAAQKKEFDELGNKFLKDEVEGNLSVDEVLNSNLPATGANSKDFWLKRIKASKKNDEGNPRLYNETISQVNTLTEDEIWELGNPDKDLGPTKPALNTKQIESLLKFKRGEVDELVNTYFKAVKPSFTGTGLLGSLKDPEGELKFFKLQAEAQQMIENSKKPNTRESGLSARDMFDPTSPKFEEFGGALIRKYKSSPLDILEAQSKALQNDGGIEPKNTAEEDLKNLLKDL